MTTEAGPGGTRGPAPTGRRSRRSILQAALGAAAAAAAANVITRGGKAEAAIGDPLLMGSLNGVPPAVTSFRSNVNGATLLVKNHLDIGDQRASVYGYLGPGDQLQTLTTPSAVAGFNYSGVGSGVRGRSEGGQFGVGVRAESSDGFALLTDGRTQLSGGYTIIANNGTDVTLQVLGPATFNSKVAIQDGTEIKKLLAGNIAGGTLSDFRLSSNIPRLNASKNTFTGKLYAASLNTGNIQSSSEITQFVQTDQMRVRVVAGPDNSTAPVFIASGMTKALKGRSFAEVKTPYYRSGSRVLAMPQRFNSQDDNGDIHVKTIGGYYGTGTFRVDLSDAVENDLSIAWFIFR